MNYKNALLPLCFLSTGTLAASNYASVELEHYTPLWNLGIGKLELEWMNGVGLGLVVPRSDVRLFTLGRNNYWNLAGAGG